MKSQRTIFILSTLAVIFAAAIFFNKGSSVKLVSVRTGTLYQCPSCGGQSDETYNKTVPKENAGEYAFKTHITYCTTCAAIDTTIAVTHYIDCGLCGKYKKWTEKQTVTKSVALAMRKKTFNTVCKRCRNFRVTTNTAGNYGAIWRGGGINLWSRPKYGTDTFVTGCIGKPGSRIKILDFTRDGEREKWVNVESGFDKGWVKLYLLKGETRAPAW